MYKINEIFTSIQGEGTHLGLRCNFIRLSGCNLSCEWCDTDFKESTFMTIKEIVGKLDLTSSYTIITGGEPTMTNLLPLVNVLLETKQKIAIETNGTFVINPLIEKFCHITCSPKPPLYQINCQPNEIKLVIDKTITLSTINMFAERFNVPVWLQPMSQQMEWSWKKALQLQKDTIYQDRIRIGIQLHKIIDVK